MYTFLTVLHVIVCIFLMLVVLLQAGRGGGIGLAFGGSGGSQSVFGSSGGATFLTKLTAVCAIIFFANSLALAYMSSQSDSRRLQKIAEKKAQAKKAEDATNVKMLTDIEKQREEQAKSAAAKSSAGAPAEGTAGQENGEKAPAAEDKAPAATGKATMPALKLALPEQGATTPGASGKLAADLKVGKPEKPVAEKKLVNVGPTPKKKVAAEKAETGEKPAAVEKPAVEKKPAATKKPAGEKKSDENSAENSTEKPAAE